MSQAADHAKVAHPREVPMLFQRGGDDSSLAQIAARSGSWDQGHFTRYFTRLVGVSPKHFR
jgi:AraC-like DNA-binding protein